MSLRGFDYLMITCIREIKKKIHTLFHQEKEGKEIVFMEPLLCARHPVGDGRAWPGQHTHHIPAAKRASPLCGPALCHSVSPCLIHSVLKSPPLAFSAPVLAPLLDLHSNRRLSQNHRILLSHIFGHGGN